MFIARYIVCNSNIKVFFSNITMSSEFLTGFDSKREKEREREREEEREKEIGS